MEEKNNKKSKPANSDEKFDNNLNDNHTTPNIKQKNII